MQKYINDQEYRGLVSKICRDMVLDNWMPDYVVSVGRGGALASLMISHYFNLRYFSIDISLSHDPPITHSCWWMAEDAFGMTNGTPAKILIVDDINDKGATLQWIVNDWSKSCHPTSPKWNDIWGKSVRFATVIDNLSSNFPYKINYIGKTINKAEEDVWIVFPYENWWESK